MSGRRPDAAYRAYPSPAYPVPAYAACGYFGAKGSYSAIIFSILA